MPRDQNLPDFIDPTDLVLYFRMRCHGKSIAGGYIWKLFKNGLEHPGAEVVTAIIPTHSFSARSVRFHGEDGAIWESERGSSYDSQYLMDEMAQDHPVWVEQIA
jgi:hypothetical protein